MKLSKEWRNLTREQRVTWNLWARNNTVLLEDGSRRRVSGQKAFTIILNNRALAGEAANASVVPAAVTWLDGALSTADAGPWTQSVGYVGFRTAQALESATKWFVWATPPVLAGEADPHRLLRFVTCLSLAAAENDELIPTFGTQYAAVLGSWDGPGEEGLWDPLRFVWFRVHQYSGGQLSPGRMMKGNVEVEL